MCEVTEKVELDLAGGAGIKGGTDRRMVRQRQGREHARLVEDTARRPSLDPISLSPDQD